MKTITIATSGLALLLLTGAGVGLYHFYRVTPPATITPDQAFTNKRWQEQFRPRVDIVIDRLEARGLDVTRAQALCDRTILSVDEGSDCIDELERLQGLTPEARQ